MKARVITSIMPAKPEKTIRWYEVGPYFSFNRFFQSHICQARKNPTISRSSTPKKGKNERRIMLVPEVIKSSGKVSKVIQIKKAIVEIQIM